MAARCSDWYVAETGRGLEGTAVHHLNNQGYSVYLPRYRERRSASGVRRVLPMFPSYVFIAASAQWRAINGTRGVRRLILSAEAVPARMHGEIIQGFRDSEDELGYIRIEDEEPPALVVGKFYTVTHGLFAQRRGVFRGMTSAQRCKMLFELLGRQVESEVLVRHLA